MKSLLILALATALVAGVVVQWAEAGSVRVFEIAMPCDGIARLHDTIASIVDGRGCGVVVVEPRVIEPHVAATVLTALGKAALKGIAALIGYIV